VALEGGDALILTEPMGEGRWLVASRGGGSLLGLMERHGRLPLPPYIKKYPDDPTSYQTVYAAALGSAAAPTAGLHFTPGLLQQLRSAGVGPAYVPLHAGLDTFQPIRETFVEDHKIHREAFTVGGAALAALRTARAEGRRLIAVGTTATRVLETLGGLGVLDPGAAIPAPDVDAVASVTPSPDGGITGSTQIYLTPGYRFKAVDVLLTNFHLPHSTVLALTMAFAGVERLRDAYAEAIAMRYRFFSFGDSMLVEGSDADV
jgi:S-adenosylmethionine:tRNA ribosyltransferase-isomerase